MDKKLIHSKLNLFVLNLAIVLTLTTLLSGCSQSFYQPTTFASDDMYSSHNRDEIIKQKQAEAEAYAQVMEQRREYWADELGLSTQASTQSDIYSSPYGEKLARLSGTTEYVRPSSYYELQYDAALDELAKYDPSEYNAYIDDNGEVIVESKYINSMYGVWGTPYSSYAWTYGYPSWTYYSAWGYPRHSMWWGYNYNFAYGLGYGYSPFYYDPWWGVYPYYGFGYNWYRPSVRPPHYGGGGGSSRPKTIVRQPNISSSPSSSVGKRNANGSTVGSSSGTTYNRGGTTRSTTTTPKTTTPTRTQTPTRVTTPSSTSSPSRSTNRIGR